MSYDDVKWDTLIRKIREGNCTPFIGAGTCYGSLPLAADLAKSLLAEEEKKSGPSPLPDREDLAKVCQYLAVVREDDLWPKSQIRDLLGTYDAPGKDDEDEPHNVLASLNLPTYLTTNYDSFMYSAVQRRHPNAKQEIARWTGNLLDEQVSAFDNGFQPDADSPVVFHLHGRLGIPESMVASEDDYLDFLVTISREIASSPSGPSQRTVLPLRIRRALTNSTLLFIGYSLTDINFRVILRGLVSGLPLSKRQLHVAVQYPDKKTTSELQAYLERYLKWTLDLSVFWGDARSFCTELRKRMAK